MGSTRDAIEVQRSDVASTGNRPRRILARFELVNMSQATWHSRAKPLDLQRRIDEISRVSLKCSGVNELRELDVLASSYLIPLS